MRSFSLSVCWRLAAGAVLVSAPTVACAAGDFDNSDWIVTIGGSVGASPPYEGAPSDNVRPSLIFNVRRADQPYRFTPPDDGGSLSLIASKHFDFGPVLNFRDGRGDTGKLVGFDKIGFAVEPGLFTDVWATDWLRARVQVRQGVVGNFGFVGDAGIDFIHTGKRWDFSLGPRYGFGDARYMDTYFGVTPIEAARNPFLNKAYEPGAGARYGGVEAAYGYQFTPRIRAVIGMGYHRLAKIAADSPVVALDGSRDQYLATLGVSYSFGVRLGHHHDPK